MHIQTVGSGYPMILLHGLLGSGENFRALAAKMRGWQVYLPDLRNHGASPWSDEFSVELLAQDLADLIKHLNLDQKPIVAGFSLGGKVAMELALSRPDLMKGMISFDMSPLELEPRFPLLLSTLLSLDLNGIKERSEIQERIMTMLNHKDKTQYVMKNLVLSQNGHWSWRFNMKSLQENYDRLWASLASGRCYKGLAFFLLGEDSDFVMPRDEASIKVFFPDAEFERIAGASHLLYAEKPQETFKALMLWLAKNDR